METAEAVEKRKGWGWVLTVVQARRAEAADITLAAAPSEPTAWRRAHGGVRAMAEQIGVGFVDGEGREEYEQRVYRAWLQRGEPAPTTREHA